MDLKNISSYAPSGPVHKQRLAKQTGWMTGGTPQAAFLASILVSECNENPPKTLMYSKTWPPPLGLGSLSDNTIKRNPPSLHVDLKPFESRSGIYVTE